MNNAASDQGAISPHIEDDRHKPSGAVLLPDAPDLRAALAEALRELEQMRRKRDALQLELEGLMRHAWIIGEGREAEIRRALATEQERDAACREREHALKACKAMMQERDDALLELERLRR